MTLSRTFTASAAAAVLSLLFSMHASAARERGPFARSLNQVNAIWLDSNSCANGLSDEIEDRGFELTGSRRSADAILSVDFHPRNSEMGISAHYSATLQGEDGRVLFRTAGHETSLTLAELCSDVSDDILDRMEKRMS